MANSQMAVAAAQREGFAPDKVLTTARFDEITEIRIYHPKVIEGEARRRSEEHTSELQSPCNLVCRLLLEKKKKVYNRQLSKPVSNAICALPNVSGLFLFTGAASSPVVDWVRSDLTSLYDEVMCLVLQVP